jgi:hypothetical protein
MEPLSAAEEEQVVDLAKMIISAVGEWVKKNDFDMKLEKPRNMVITALLGAAETAPGANEYFKKLIVRSLANEV